MLFRRALESSADSKSKNFAGETFKHFARETIKTKDGCLSPRSILPRCFTSISTFSATCQILSFLDLRMERSKLPNCEAGVTRVMNSDNNRGGENQKPPIKS